MNPCDLDALPVWRPDTGVGAQWGQRFAYIPREAPSHITCGQQSTRYGCGSRLTVNRDTLYIMPGHWIVCRYCRDAAIRRGLI